MQTKIKICSKCKQNKFISDFYKDKHKKSGITSACKTCRSKAYNTWERKNKQKIKQYSRKSNLKKWYDLTIDDWQQMFEKQQGCCAICGKHQSDESMRLHVDHNHITKQVRKLLCSNCNRMLGCAKENIEILENAISYLNEHNFIQKSEAS